MHRTANEASDYRNGGPVDMRTRNGPASMPGRAVGELVLLLRSRSGGLLTRRAFRMAGARSVLLVSRRVFRRTLG